MNFVHKDALTEEDWKMIKSGQGFALTDKEAEEMALDILEELEYDLTSLKKKKTISNCPICESFAYKCVESYLNEWDDRAEKFFVECCNKSECGLRTPNFWTEQEAVKGWERICEKAKVQS